MDDDSDLGSVLELSRGMDGSDEDGPAGGCRRGRRRDSDEPNELGVFSMFAVFCQVVIGQCGVSFPSEKAVGFSPVRNWPVIARVLLFHCIRA